MPSLQVEPYACAPNRTAKEQWHHGPERFCFHCLLLDVPAWRPYRSVWGSGVCGLRCLVLPVARAAPRAPHKWALACSGLAPTHITGFTEKKKESGPEGCCRPASPHSDLSVGPFLLALGSGAGLRGFNNILRRQNARGPH